MLTLPSYNLIKQQKGLHVKMITITLTQEQATTLIVALGYAINPDASNSDNYNQHLNRLINKIEKAINDNQK